MKEVMKKLLIFILKLKEFVFRKKAVSLILIFSLIVVIYIIPSSFAVLTPVKSIEIESEKLNYKEENPGSWKITKSAKWTGKGEAEITFDVDSILRKSLKERNKKMDLLFVLDTSDSMEGEKIAKVKSDTIELIESLLSDGNNKAGLISFNSTSLILSNFTNDKSSLISKINGLTVDLATNYYQALVNVDNVLKNYKNEADRDCIILFLTDGHPCEETPNEVGEYFYLKSKYPYITINGIQYEMGEEISDKIKRISDNQYTANMETLKKVLFTATTESSEAYESFEISDFIENDYFYVEKSSDIKVDFGKVTFDKSTQKITWNADGLSSGKSPKMTIKIKLKNELIGTGGVYPTNKSEEVMSKIEDDADDVVSEDSPILADNYKVIYDGNAPDDCTVTGVPITRSWSVYDTVEISDSIPKCEGYYFKKWEVKNEKAERLNNDYFIMPEDDVTIRAIWKKLKINKSSDGELAKAQTLYEFMADNSVLDDRASEFVTAESGIDFNANSSNTNGKGIYEFSSTKDDKYPVYYYRGQVNNNVKFANLCWKIVRTTDTGGVKLIYNGAPNSSGWCNNSGSASYIAGYYNSGSADSVAGYMYGSLLSPGRYKKPTNVSSSNFGRGYIYGNDIEWDGTKYTLKNTFVSSGWTTDRLKIAKGYHYSCFSTTLTSCSSVRVLGSSFSTTNIIYSYTLSNGKNIGDLREEIHANLNESLIKQSIDKWYEGNLLSYTDYLEDTIWCNDRHVVGGTLYDKDDTSGSSIIYNYGGGVRTLSCLELNDSFTVNSKSGNGMLKYPVATITAFENNLAGASTTVNSSYYLFINNDFWTMTPANISSVGTVIVAGGTWKNGVGHISSHAMSASTSNYTIGIRPSVSLAPGACVSEGDGTTSDPFVIDLTSFKK